MTSEELKRLSEAAEQGAWCVEIEGPGSWGRIASIVVEKDDTQDVEFAGSYDEPDAAFVVALVNAYRSGDLIHRDDAPTITALTEFAYYAPERSRHPDTDEEWVSMPAEMWDALVADARAALRKDDLREMTQLGEEMDAGDDVAKAVGAERDRTEKLDYFLQEEENNRTWPRLIDIAYTAFMRAKGKNDEDGGPTDWFTDTKPMIDAEIERARGRLLPAAIRARSAERGA